MIYAMTPYSRTGIAVIFPNAMSLAARKQVSNVFRHRADQLVFRSQALQIALNHIPATDSPRYEQTLYETMGAELRAVELIELCEAFEG